MQIHHQLPSRSIVNPILTVGTFDGVHIGHQQILARLTEIAEETKGNVTVLTFNPHPRLVLYPEQKDLLLLSSQKEKSKLLEQYGVHHLIYLPFTYEFSRMGYDDFVKQIFVDGIHPKKVVIGYDHHFGRNREGGIKQLKLLSVIYNFEVEEIPEQDIDYAAVSSTRIRKALLAGDITSANQLLGHDYTISGIVIKGRQLGRTLGFPTANIQTESFKLIPANGVYAVFVHLNGIKYPGMLSIGNRPTFDNGERSVEVNILDFNTDIYNEEISISIKYRLRDDLKFSTKEMLIEQMYNDRDNTIKLLAI